MNMEHIEILCPSCESHGNVVWHTDVTQGRCSQYDMWTQVRGTQYPWRKSSRHVLREVESDTHISILQSNWMLVGHDTAVDV